MRLLKIIAAIAVAFVLMYAETWAIQESPIWWSESAETFVTDTGAGDTDGPLCYMAGPIAAPALIQSADREWQLTRLSGN